LYIGRVNNFAQGGLAVSVGGSGTTIINDGRFEVTAGNINDTNLASLSVSTTTATVTLNGGGFYQGINGGTRNISTFLSAGKSLYTTELGSTTVPANVTRVTHTVWVR
jgi:hypothetical protein